MKISKYIKLFLLLIAFIACFNNLHAQDFNVSYVSGHQYSYKPSLSQRLQGINDVVVIVPKSQSKVDQYYYACIVNYFKRLGVPTRTYPAYFNKKNQQIGSLQVVWGELSEGISDCWSDANTLVVIANVVSSYGYYLGEEEIAQITVIDPVNDYRWEFKFDMPNKEEKFDSKLKSLISSHYSFNKNSMQVNPHYKSNWTGEWKFKDYFNANNYHPLEGVYEGDNYKVAVKKASDGIFYLVYLAGKGNPKAWSVGDIKGVLQPTATPTIFKCKWYGRWKQTMDYTIIFKDGLMTVYDEDKEPEQYIKLYPALLSQQESEPTSRSGTGFALKNGYIVTNYHVIDGATSILIKGVKGDFNKSYNATVIGTDKNNDLALLKISDSSFTSFGTIPYSISSTSAEVGEDIFVLGYPLTSTMGDEIKLTTGIISSKTGFQGDVSLYQISAPIQPGNSGGPLFDKKGNVIGIVSAKHAGAENVGYAIKASYLRNLIESCVSNSVIPTSNTVSTLPLTGKVKNEKNFVFFIECSSSSSATANTVSSNNSSASKVYNYPSVTSKGDNKLTVISVAVSPESTILELSSNNSFSGGYYQWFSISPEAYISVNGTKYKLRSADGIALAPNVTYFSHENETKTFRLTFPPIPSNTTSFDFVESKDSEWKLLGIQLR
ncbi:MAG: serine protease [Bacteroidales bacterium]|nr:serine protease [Bacteroidales bacterium]